jgi:predicted nucleotidyltransferase
MTRKSIEPIVEALNTHGVRYLIAGGLAVVAHGYVRFTADVDIILDLDPDNVNAAIAAFDGLGYRPRAPVPFRELADATKRNEWVRERGLTVFSLYSDAHPATEVDLFVHPPLDFDTAHPAGVRIDIAPGVQAVFVSYEDLLRLKTQAGRPQDLEDIRQLKTLRGDESRE